MYVKLSETFRSFYLKIEPFLQGMRVNKRNWIQSTTTGLSVQFIWLLLTPPAPLPAPKKTKVWLWKNQFSLFLFLIYFGGFLTTMRIYADLCSVFHHIICQKLYFYFNRIGNIARNRFSDNREVKIPWFRFTGTSDIHVPVNRGTTCNLRNPRYSGVWKPIREW